MRIPRGKNRPAIMWTLGAAMIALVVVVGILWTIFKDVIIHTRDTFFNKYPYGVYNPADVSVVNFIIDWFPFLILLSIAIMVIVAIQRRKAGQGGWVSGM